MLNIIAAQIGGPSTGGLPAGIVPKVWLDASDTTTYTLNGSTVSEWRDKSANAYVFSQGTAASQPTRITSGLNSKNTIRWDGTDKLDSTAAASTWKFLHDGTNYLFCMVAKFKTQAGYLLITNSGSSGNSGAMVSWNTSASMTHQVTKGEAGNSAIINTTANSTYASDTWKNVGILADPDNGTAANRSDIKINNGSSIKNNTLLNAVSTANPSQTWLIGAYINDTGTDRMIGEVAEIIIVEGAQATDANRTELYNYLNAKWGV